MGIFLIGGCPYFCALRSQSERELHRSLEEQATGVKSAPPDQEQSAREWNRDMIMGATVGGAIWVVGMVSIAIRIWRERAVPGPGKAGEQQKKPAGWTLRPSSTNQDRFTDPSGS
jgi:hypothetical protein